MSPPRYILLASVLVHTCSHAQVTPIGDLAGDATYSVVLGDGSKFYERTSSGIQLYNADLTPYRFLTFPALPAGSIYADWPAYISETLFDNDPSTIEYAVPVRPDTAFEPRGLWIAREDGTTLFSSDSLELFGAHGWPGITTAGAIVDSPEGAVMALRGHATGGTYFFRLAGHLPCTCCHEEGTAGIGEVTGGHDLPGLLISPNPTSGSVRIQYHIPDGENEGSIVIHDLMGKMIARRSVSMDGTIRFETDQWAQGMYLCHWETAARKGPGVPFSVVR